jgi:ankyrin repeat protein
MATRAELFQYVRDGSVDACARILLQGISINSKDDTGNTPLHVAAEKGNTDIAKFLLHRAGIQRNARNMVCGFPSRWQPSQSRIFVVVIILLLS